MSDQDETNDMLVLCIENSNLGKIDFDKVGAGLGIKKNSAYKRYSRFMKKHNASKAGHGNRVTKKKAKKVVKKSKDSDEEEQAENDLEGEVEGDEDGVATGNDEEFIDDSGEMER